jgi:formylglycine-generating enzyme required for sulfatase activity
MNFLSRFATHHSNLTALAALVLTSQTPSCIERHDHFHQGMDQVQGDNLADHKVADTQQGDAVVEVAYSDMTVTDKKVLDIPVPNDADSLDLQDTTGDIVADTPDANDSSDSQDVPDIQLAKCGDGECNGLETCATCEADCNPCCGNDTCDNDETQCTCPADCFSGCACCDGDICVAEASDSQCGKGAKSCEECTGYFECINGGCECVPDCGAWLCGGDGCGGSCGEICSEDEYCDVVCFPKCGNGQCDNDETCESCPGDCGECGCLPGVSSGKKTAGQHGVTWVAIPGGCFMMGCSPGDGSCQDDEKPPHEVNVSPFEMLETEVTEAQWAAVVLGDPAPSCDYNGGGGANSPVECIDWDEAKAFCEALDPNGRLCTEAEWEYAARGGTTTKYYCGDDSECLADVAWYSSNSDDGPGKHKHVVKGKTPNGYGLYDMLGNVWEWVDDCWHSDYDLNKDGQGDWDVGYPAWTTNCSGSGRVRRGGSFDFTGGYLRVSFRDGDVPSNSYDDLGSRCCRSE